jgi:hypothetical protein
MDVALRVLLREFRSAPTDVPGERRINRDVAWMPSRGGRCGRLPAGKLGVE